MLLYTRARGDIASAAARMGTVQIGCSNRISKSARRQPTANRAPSVPFGRAISIGRRQTVHAAGKHTPWTAGGASWCMTQKGQQRTPITPPHHHYCTCHHHGIHHRHVRRRAIVLVACATQHLASLKHVDSGVIPCHERATDACWVQVSTRPRVWCSSM